ncbi:MAG TPA: FGGY-family carbohydrate kinase [Candidatus Baltobacteraceae bacterium]|nr:FGGY-family carbohydrate kinase [Candidatus Baltobacteraceae bacterium]
MSADLLLAIDNGTQSVRALVFDARGELLARTRVELNGYSSPQPGWHEHDPNAFWTAVCSACQALWQEHPQLRDRIAALAVTTQRATVINVDENGEPLRPAITWLDQRKALDVPAISPLWRAAFAAAGVSRTIRYFQREAEANWIRTQQPQVWNATRKYVLLSGFLLHKFCGRFVDSIGSQVAYIPFDYKALRWASRGDWKWQALRIDRDLLPELVPPAAIIGEITDSASAQTGIPRGTRIVAAAADKACEVLGAGCVDPSVACLSYGTTATINLTTPRYIEATPFIPPYPAALPNAYNTEVQIFRGYWMVSWFKEQFGVWGDELVASVPPGAMGLMLQPYWSPGLKNPGPEAKGAIIGFGDVHTRSHVYRAILEGLAFALREGKERIEKRGRLTIRALRVAGGGSQSDAAMQITADVFGLAASRPHVYETSGLGAAITAAVGIGLHPDFESAVRAMTRVQRVFEPIEQNRRIYDALYHRVYQRMYAQLRPLYEAIREITGYPQG